MQKGIFCRTVANNTFGLGNVCSIILCKMVGCECVRLHSALSSVVINRQIIYEILLHLIIILQQPQTGTKRENCNAFLCAALVRHPLSGELNTKKNIITEHSQLHKISFLFLLAVALQLVPNILLLFSIQSITKISLYTANIISREAAT